MDDFSEWQLRLERSTATTKYTHFTVLADGKVEVGSLGDGFSCRPGAALMTMHVWAGDAAEAEEMIRAIGTGIGFSFTGAVEVFITDPRQLPKRSPFGYEINFEPYKARA